MVGLNMRSHFLICFVVGLALAHQNNPAWKGNTEYTYEVQGRSLSGVSGITDEYTGIVLRAKLVVQPLGADILRCQINEPEFAEIQTKLPEGWRSKLPEDKLNYKPLKMTNKPFEVLLKNGIVKDLLVEQEFSQWETNIIKSMVSQFQLDTKGENVIPSKLNLLPTQGSNNAVFKTVEDTVAGITKTIYDIHPMPEYILLSEPHLAPLSHLKGDGSIIEIVKTKNFTESHALPAYWSNLGNFGRWRLTGNRLGSVIHRNSISRAVVTGDLQRHTIQYSETSNTIVIKTQQHGEATVNSMMRVKLLNAEQASNKLPAMSSPVHTGSLVFTYQNEKNEGRVTKGRTFDASEFRTKGDIYEDNIQEYSHKRHPRSLIQNNDNSEISVESQEDWTEKKPELKSGIQAPMLPLRMGYNGLSIKKAPGINVIEKVISIAQKIASDFEKPQEMLKKETLSRFITLTSILRLLDEEELKSVANRLYTPETTGHRYNSWIVFRDSVAETGTGAALMTIKYFIETKKIQGHEANQIISTMGGAVRQPTEEYMKTFFKMVKHEIDQQETSSLNETMLLTFSEVIHSVYVNGRFSHREYPSHASGNFYTSAGKAFLYDDVLPYLDEQLKQAIINGESRKILAYIRALGQIGDPKIVKSFQPYLEGKKVCSQFQRLFMVLSMRKVADIEPRKVQAILYRIYQNVGERTEMRVAAIYVLMHTSPSAEMLQRIAVYTNFESNHRVCAAVKSAIQSAAKLEGHRFAELRSAAESASLFLTKRNFGIQDSQDLLKSHAFHNWEAYYKYVLQTIVSEESGIPSSFYLALEGEGQGYRTKTFSFESVISDIRNLGHVFKKNTQWYRQEQEKKQTSEQSEQSSWSSSKIAHALNLKTEELEQLEGFISFQLGEIKRQFMFDNHTIENLPQYVQQLMLDWENGKKFEYTKIFNQNDGSIAYPTEIGLPFILTYDVPILVRLEGEMKAKAYPQVASNNEFVLPEKIQVGGQFKLILSAKQQMKYGFVTPFNHHLYQVGRDDDVQIYLPVKVESYIDFKNNKLHYEIEPLETERNIDIFQMVVTPYTIKQDILDLDAVAERKNLHVIRKNNPTKWEKVVGDKSTGMAFLIKYENDGELTSMDAIFREFYEIGALYKKFKIEYVPELSKNKKMVADWVYKEEHMKDCSEEEGKAMVGKLSKLSSHQDQRVSEIVKYASAGIQNARMQVLDSRVQFSGEKNVEYILTMSYARNQEDSKRRMLAYVKKHNEKSHGKPFAGALSVKFDMARVTGLDMDYIMNTDLKSSIYVDGAFAETLPTENQFEFHAKLRRSDERKQYLMEQPLYHRCQRETQQGNKQLLACANMTQMAGLLDSMNIKMNFHKMCSEDFHDILTAYNSLFPEYKFEIEDRHRKHKQGEVEVQVSYSPDLERVNMSVSTRDTHAYMKNRKVWSWAKPIVIVHPIFNVVDRVAGKWYSLKTYKPICSMDKTEAYTFDGSEYPLTLNDHWTVLMQYVPLRSSGDSYSSVEEQLRNELKNYVVLAKRSTQGSEEKDVKIVVSTPKTQGKVVEINLKPKTSHDYPQVFVDGKPITVRKNGESDTYYKQVTILGLPNSEVYVRVHDDFYVIYDGTRVKITSLGMELRNRIRGLCGNFNSFRSDDFTTSSNCVVRNPKELIASYTVLKEGEYSPEVNEYKKNVEKKCVYKKVPLYVNYISGHEESSQHWQQSSPACMKYQTRYVEENDQICFTIRPLNVCSPDCSAQNKVYKNVEVHCVQNKNVASLWKAQIEKGASPDFSQKPVTKTVQLEVPHYCRSL